MPIYEYQCQNCGYQHEAFQSVNEAPLTLCPKCDRPALSKLISSTSFQLKGSGWYQTDYVNKEKSKPSPDQDKTTPTNTEKKDTQAEKKDSSSTPSSTSSDTKAAS